MEISLIFSFQTIQIGESSITAFTPRSEVMFEIKSQIKTRDESKEVPVIYSVSFTASRHLRVSTQNA
jgi:hypothetical protein